jgi:hypothetical protein
VLTHGKYYNYCVSIASAQAKGKGQVVFRLSHGATLVQSAVIIKKQNYAIVPNGVWYYCSGYMQLPGSPGAATLSAIVSYWPAGSDTPTQSALNVSVLLK